MTPEDKAKVNRLLAQNGLGRLDDPGLVSQVGFLMGQALTGHEDLRIMLNKCEPAERGNMMEAIKPYLRFVPHTLDVYTAETGRLAEAKQLPLIGENGKLFPFRTQEVNTSYAAANEALPPTKQEKQHAADLKTAQAAIERAAAKGHMNLDCARCTFSDSFPGWNRAAAMEKAWEAGWRYNASAMTDLCPNCAPKPKAN